MIKLIDLLEEKHMTPTQKKKRGEIFDKLVSTGMSKEKAGAIATSKAMSEKLDPVGQEDADINNDGKVNKTDKYLKHRRDVVAKNLKEESIPKPLASLYDLVEKLVAQGITKDEILRIVNFATAGTSLNEGDHEVAMAQSSLKDIAKAAIELSQKMGGEERNIPGWIQNHITNAENYIEQAAQGFHELKNDE